MPENPIRYPTVLFDWGDTVMRDDPASTIPMVEWQTVEVKVKFSQFHLGVFLWAS